MTYHIISSNDLNQVDKEKSIILDVRSKMEHNEKRLAQQHINVALDELDAGKFIENYCPDKEKTILILCGGGTRAKKAADKFIAAGYKNIQVIEGGLKACESSNQKLEGYATNYCSTIKTPISLERQVRIAAGAIASMGSLLALIFNNADFAIIPLSVGAGLIFAGVTNRCGMALLLIKAPWNKIK